MKYVIETLISKEEIKQRVAQLGQEISAKYQDSNDLVLIGLLRGAFIFLADLSRAISIDHQIDFMSVSSYGDNLTSSGDLKILKDLDDDIQGKDVIVIEDIIDTGNTLSKIKSILMQKTPKSFTICSMLDKPSRREVAVDLDLIGFSIADEFVVGYGLDYAQKHRNLPYIGKVVFKD